MYPYCLVDLDDQNRRTNAAQCSSVKPSWKEDLTFQVSVQQWVLSSLRIQVCVERMGGDAVSRGGRYLDRRLREEIVRGLHVCGEEGGSEQCRPRTPRFVPSWLVRLVALPCFFAAKLPHLTHPQAEALCRCWSRPFRECVGCFWFTRFFFFFVPLACVVVRFIPLSLLSVRPSVRPSVCTLFCPCLPLFVRLYPFLSYSRCGTRTCSSRTTSSAT